MNFRRTVIIAIIFFLIAGFYYFYEIKGAPEREKMKKKETSVFSISADEIEKMTLKREDANFVFVRKDDTWFIDEPIKAKADQPTLNYFSRAVAESKKDVIVEESATDLEKYGLEEPAYTIGVSMGDTREVLLLGDQSVDAKYYYGKRQNSPEVFLTESGFKHNLEKSLLGYRDKSIFDFSAENVNKVVLHSPQHHYIFVKKGTKWTTETPRIPHEGSREISLFVSSVCGMKTKSFTEVNSANLKKFGITDSDFWVEVYTSKREDPYLLKIGKPGEKDRIVYAKLDSADEIFAISKRSAAQLKKKPSDFINRSLMELETDRVAMLTAKIDGKHFKFEKVEDPEKGDSADEWKMVLPVPGKVKAGKIDLILNNLASLYVSDAFFPEENLEKYNLDNPTMTIRGQRADTKEMFLFEIGGKVEEPGAANTNNKEDKPKKSSSFYAKLKGEEAVLIIGERPVNNLKEKFMDLLEKKIQPESKKSE